MSNIHVSRLAYVFRFKFLVSWCKICCRKSLKHDTGDATGRKDDATKLSLGRAKVGVGTMGTFQWQTQSLVGCQHAKAGFFPVSKSQEKKVAMGSLLE